MDTPFDEDQFVLAEAAKRGFAVYRRAVIEIDKDLLPTTYYRRSPDYSKIRAALDQQLPVPGATLTQRVEFVLTPYSNKGSENA